MNTQQTRIQPRIRTLKSSLKSWLIVGMCALSVQTALAQVQLPQAARRIRLHRIQTHRENVAGAVEERRGNVAGAVQDRRENIAGARQERSENIAGRRAAAAAARTVLPRYAPATVATSGSIVFPPAPAPTVAPPPPTVPSAEPPAQSADVSEGLHSDEVPDMFEGSESYPVTRIEDGGGTVVLKMGKGESKVRMVGVAAVALGERVNLPERLSGVRLPSTETFVENLLKGERVYVVYDTHVAEQDADKNCVAYLFRAPDGLMVNLEVIRAGFAVPDTRYDFDQKALFTKYQDSARQAGKGIYGIVQRIKAARGD